VSVFTTIEDSREHSLNLYIALNPQVGRTKQIGNWAHPFYDFKINLNDIQTNNSFSHRSEVSKQRAMFL
jgi:hypothetical protein